MTDLPEIPKPPKQCDCGRLAALNRIEVEHVMDRQRRVGPFSDFGSVEGRNKRLVLRPTWRFIRWWAQCSECVYTEEARDPQMELQA